MIGVATAERQTHLARRLESFGDVVFGFAMGQLALQLGVPKAAADLYARPEHYLFYFVTFAAIAALWMTFHRLLSSGFRPERTELVLVFVYLAFVGLLPYSLVANLRFEGQQDAARYGLGAYLVCASGTFVPAAAIYVRNLRRPGIRRTPNDDAALRAAVLRSIGVAATFVVSLAVDAFYGAAVAGPVVGAGTVAAVVVARRARRSETPCAAAES